MLRAASYTEQYIYMVYIHTLC